MRMITYPNWNNLREVHSSERMGSKRELTEYVYINCSSNVRFVWVLADAWILLQVEQGSQLFCLGACAIDREILIVVGSKKAGIKAKQAVEFSLFPTNKPVVQRLLRVCLPISNVLMSSDVQALHLKCRDTPVSSPVNVLPRISATIQRQAPRNRLVDTLIPIHSLCRGQPIKPRGSFARPALREYFGGSCESLIVHPET